MSKKIYQLLFGLAMSAALSTQALAALPTTGTCGFVGNFSYPFTYLYGNNPGNGWGLNWLGTINFSTSTITINVVFIDPVPPLPPRQSQQSYTATFTTSSGPITGASTITFSVNGGSLALNLMPVNSGNTILVQGGPVFSDGGFTGVCQM
jgi:hypothetical protein